MNPTTKITPFTGKRRIKRNVYGNIRGYVGTRAVWDFGLSDQNAAEWLRDGSWLTFNRGEDAICTPRLDGSHECDYSPVPAGFKWVNPLKIGESVR